MAKGYSGSTTDFVFDLLIVVFIMASLLGTIYAQLNTLESDTTNFSTAELALITIIGIVALIGIVMRILKGAGVKRK